MYNTIEFLWLGWNCHSGLEWRDIQMAENIICILVFCGLGLLSSKGCQNKIRSELRNVIEENASLNPDNSTFSCEKQNLIIYINNLQQSLHGKSAIKFALFEKKCNKNY